MESSWPAVDVSNDRRRAIEVLIRGRELTKQLDAIIQQASADGTYNTSSSKFAGQYLVVEVLESLNETLSILMTSTDSIEVQQQPFSRKAVPQEPCGSWDSRKSSDSTVSRMTSAIKDRKGCCKRRRTSETWKRETSILIEDGHAWRKYGQKPILKAKHPRNYFRCTHKFDQGCQATKQVQKIQDDPPRYLTTYHGRHTCKNLLEASEIILASTEEESSILLSFESNNPKNKNYGPSPLSFPSAEEGINEVFQSLCHNKLSSSDNFQSPDLITFDTFEPMDALSSTCGQRDVISSGVYPTKASTCSSDMDMLVDPRNCCDDVLQYFNFNDHEEDTDIW